MEITETEKLKRLEQSRLDKIKAEQKKYLRKRTPLFDALTNIAKTKKLIKDGWDVNHVADNGLTPLLHAIKIGAKKEIIELLIESGAKPKQDYITYMMNRDIRENFELLLNIYKPHQESYKLLLATSVNQLLRRRKKKYFFLKLLEYKKNFTNIDITEILNRSENKKSPLAFEFLDDEEIDILTYLLDNGANVNAVDVNGNTLLDYAILFLSRKEEVVYLLLERGGKFSKNDKLLAVKVIENAGNEEDALRILKKILPFVEDINKLDNNGRTAIMMAMERNFKKVYKLLVSNGAEKDIFKQSECIDKILETVINSMDLNLISQIDNNLLNKVKINGHSVLGYAAKKFLLKETKPMLDLLIDKGAVFCKEDGLCFFVHDLLTGDDECLTKLIKAGLNVGDFGCEGLGFTFEAIKEGRNNIVLTLINNRECLTNTYNGAILLANVILQENYDLANTIIKLIDIKKCYDDLLDIHKKCYDPNFDNDFLKSSFFTKTVDYRINPLCASIYMQRPDILEALLNSGVTPKHHSNESSLLEDVFYYSKDREISLKLIRILVGNGVEICDWKFACYNFLPECLNLLVELGLDKNKLDWKKEDIAPLSKQEGNLLSIIKAWFYNIKKVDKANRVRDLAHTIKFLLEINADVNFVNDDGDNAITYILNKCDTVEDYSETFEILINAGIDLNHKNNDGNSAKMLVEEKFPSSTKYMNLIKKD